jgi:hypothetical protein
MQNHLPARNLIAASLLLSLWYSQVIPAAKAAPRSNTAGVKSPSLSLTIHTIISEPNTELFTPVFLPNCSKLAVVKKLHEPDGHEAEAYSEKELAALQGRAKSNPRWADPKVVIVSTADGSQEFIDFGWNPASNPAGDRIFYAHQQKPISGYRVLAQSQKGNQICGYDLTQKTKTELAAPEAGYLDSPLVSPDGTRVAFAVCDAINGDWGGQVGIGICDLVEADKKIIMPPQKHHNLFDLVGPMFWCGKDLIARLQEASSPGTYMAGAYQISVVNASAGGKVLYQEGKPSQLPDTNIAPTADDNIMVIHSNNQTKITTGGKILEKQASPTVRPAQENSGTSTSPGGLVSASWHERSLTVKNNRTGKKLSCRLPGNFSCCSWSPKNAPVKLAVIATKEKPKEMAPVFDQDALILIAIPDAPQSEQKAK